MKAKDDRLRNLVFFFCVFLTVIRDLSNQAKICGGFAAVLQMQWGLTDVPDVKIIIRTVSGKMHDTSKNYQEFVWFLISDLRVDPMSRLRESQLLEKMAAAMKSLPGKNFVVCS